MSNALTSLLVACGLLFLLLLSTSGQELLAANSQHPSAKTSGQVCRLTRLFCSRKWGSFCELPLTLLALSRHLAIQMKAVSPQTALEMSLEPIKVGQ